MALETSGQTGQLELFDTKEDLSEKQEYLTEQLITYLGNKRSLIREIDTAVNVVKERLNKKKIDILDAFAGSGVVSRYFKRHANRLVAIDIEDYSEVVLKCYLQNHEDVNFPKMSAIINRLNAEVDDVEFPKGFIEELYAPKDENNITKQDRVFYTKKNARRIDNYRRMIEAINDERLRISLLGPLLSRASVHANTSGVFKGFYKDKITKVGRYGGTNGDALKRILGMIYLDVPILSRHSCDVEIYKGNINSLASTLGKFDLVYLDPPYNQHPYGSNYFMLNLIVRYVRPTEISKVSGIPVDWRRSDYNVKSKSPIAFNELLRSIKSKYILISFNNEGFIGREQMLDMLEAISKRVEVFDIKYNTFRGCRNISGRSIHVTEQLFLVETK